MTIFLRGSQFVIFILCPFFAKFGACLLSDIVSLFSLGPFQTVDQGSALLSVHRHCGRDDDVGPQACFADVTPFVLHGVILRVQSGQISMRASVESRFPIGLSALFGELLSNFFYFLTLYFRRVVETGICMFSSWDRFGLV